MTLLPMFHSRLNLLSSPDGSQGDHSFAGGVQAAYQGGEKLTLAAGFAAGGFRNESRLADTLYAGIRAPRGRLATSQATYDLDRLGKFILVFMYGWGWDRDDATGLKKQSLYLDIKYVIPVKKLNIQPRVRVWRESNNLDEAYMLKIRPELILSAGF